MADCGPHIRKIVTRFNAKEYVSAEVSMAEMWTDNQDGRLHERGGMGSPVVLLLAVQRKGWSLMIFYARAPRERRLPSLDRRIRSSIGPNPSKTNVRAWKDQLDG